MLIKYKLHCIYQVTALRITQQLHNLLNSVKTALAFWGVSLLISSKYLGLSVKFF